MGLLKSWSLIRRFLSYRFMTYNPVSLCSCAPTIFGFSPGAWLVLLIVTAFKWVSVRTEAAQIQGHPKSDKNPFKMPMTSMLRWYETPFFNFRSWPEMIISATCDSIKSKIKHKIANGRATPMAHVLSGKSAVPIGWITQPRFELYAGLKSELEFLAVSKLVNE